MQRAIRKSSRSHQTLSVMLFVLLAVLLSACGKNTSQLPTVNDQSDSSLATQSLTRTGLSMPFPTGQSWILTSGPHSTEYNGTVRDSLDMQDKGRFDYYQAGVNVNAAGSGTLRKLADVGWGNCGAIINHGNGFQTLYYHIKVTRANGPIQRGEVVGQMYSNNENNANNCGTTTGPHLHIALRQESTDANGNPKVGIPLPVANYSLGKWQAINGAVAYDGSIRNLETGESVIAGNSYFYNDGGFLGNTPNPPTPPTPTTPKTDFIPAVISPLL